MSDDAITLRLTAREREQLTHALNFAVAQLFEFGHERDRGEIECLMAFLGRLHAAGDSLGTSREGSP